MGSIEFVIVFWWIGRQEEEGKEVKDEKRERGLPMSLFLSQSPLWDPAKEKLLLQRRREKDKYMVQN